MDTAEILGISGNSKSYHKLTKIMHKKEMKLYEIIYFSQILQKKYFVLFVFNDICYEGYFIVDQHSIFTKMYEAYI